MKILVNDIAASSGGAMTILKQFYDYVRLHNRDDEWYFLLGGSFLEETDNIHIICLPEIKRSYFKKMAFDFFAGKKKIRELSPDVVISLQNIITFGLNIPQVLYIHQSLPYQNVRKFSFFKKAERKSAFYQYLVGSIINRSARKADGVVVQTESMKKNVACKAHIPEEKIIVALPDVENICPEKKAEHSSKTFFYPTSDIIYKNNEVIAEACMCLNNEGITDYEVILTLPKGRITHPNIKCVGYMDKNHVFDEYCNSTLLFPSDIETVGLPLLEAKQCGTLILSTDRPFAREVLADYENAYYFNPREPDQLACLMKQVLNRELTIKPVKQNIEYHSNWGKVIEYIKHFSK